MVLLVLMLLSFLNPAHKTAAFEDVHFVSASFVGLSGQPSSLLEFIAIVTSDKSELLYAKKETNGFIAITRDKKNRLFVNKFFTDEESAVSNYRISASHLDKGERQGLVQSGVRILKMRFEDRAGKLIGKGQQVLGLAYELEENGKEIVVKYSTGRDSNTTRVELSAAVFVKAKEPDNDQKRKQD